MVAHARFRARQIIQGLAILLLLIGFPLVVRQSFHIHVMILVLMFGMLGVAWNIMGGYAGMFSFGQAAFFGIGAYTSSYLSFAYGVNPWIGLVAGGCAAAVVAAAIGYPCSNLRGHYFAIATIAFAEIVRIVFNNWKMVGAAEGLSLPMQNESFANFLFNSSKLPYYYIMLAFLLVSLAVCYSIATSKMGYYFRAIKESHKIAEVLGVDVVLYRLMAIMISAFLSAMAGTFYAQYILYIDPGSVMLLATSIQIVLIAMLGGAGSIMGPVIGAAILIPASEYTRVTLGYKGTGLDMLIYGLLITLISMYYPDGVWKLFSRMGRNLK
ncbi:MAG TPA: branched-chain amino acid ABC transporter permease [Nitrospiraceae bacterium]|nr:branched-chain amino acid ABC transporter permease [Nitrospiraceae bacterium]